MNDSIFSSRVFSYTHPFEKNASGSATCVSPEILASSIAKTTSMSQDMSSDDDTEPPHKRSRIDATPKRSCLQTRE